jgi:hypothetical protein
MDHILTFQRGSLDAAIEMVVLGTTERRPNWVRRRCREAIARLEKGILSDEYQPLQIQLMAAAATLEGGLTSCALN